jgi:hypothetical protein
VVACRKALQYRLDVVALKACFCFNPRNGAIPVPQKRRIGRPP